MQFFMYILLGFLVVCAISVSLSKNLLNSILIYMSYSLVMSVIWILLESPDLAITEAAVGAGITSLLFFVTLKKIHAIGADDARAAQNDTETAQADAATQNDTEAATRGTKDAGAGQADNSGEEEQKHE